MSELPAGRKPLRKICFTAAPACAQAGRPVGFISSAPPRLPSCGPLKPCCKSTTSVVPADSDSESVSGSVSMQPIRSSMTSITSLDEISTEHYERQIERSRSNACASGNDTSKMNGEMNEIFLNRLKEIDSKAQGDRDLKLITYQEWVDMLLAVNETIVGNMEDLERDVSERLEMIQQRSKMSCRSSQGNELAKCRKDIGTLIKIIQNGYHNDNWNMQGLQFETVSHAQVFGAHDICQGMQAMQVFQGDGSPRRESLRENISRSQSPRQPSSRSLTPRQEGSCPQSPREDTVRSQSPRKSSQCEAEDLAEQRNKQMAVHMRALAVEVAEKHDEVRELKKQMLCMEDEVQKAQAKIQLKDDVVRELRIDLRNANAKISGRRSDPSCYDMPPVDVESVETPPVNVESVETPPDNVESVETPPDNVASTETLQNEQNVSPSSNIIDTGRMLYLNDDSSQYDTLSQHEQVETQKLRVLEDELNELFEMTKDLKKQNLESHRKRLSDIFSKSEAEKAEAYRKLDFMRRQLIDLVATTNSESTVQSTADGDSGFGSKADHDRDAKLVDAVRKQLLKLNVCSLELKKQLQKMEIESNDVVSKLKTEKDFSDRNSQVLREVAYLLTEMSGVVFAYDDIYSAEGSPNPFCEAILVLKKAFHKREEQLLCNLASRDEKIKDLEMSFGCLQEELSECKSNSKANTNKSHTNTSNTSTSTGFSARTVSTPTTTTTATATTRTPPTNTTTMQQDIARAFEQHKPQQRVLTAPQCQQECKQPVDSDTDFEHAWDW